MAGTNTRGCGAPNKAAALSTTSLLGEETLGCLKEMLDVTYTVGRLATDSKLVGGLSLLLLGGLTVEC